MSGLGAVLLTAWAAAAATAVGPDTVRAARMPSPVLERGPAGAAPNSLVVASSRGERQVAVRVERGWPAVAALDLETVLSINAAVSTAGAASLSAVGQRFDFVLDAAYFRFAGRVFALAAAPYVARDSLFVPLQFLIEYLPRLAADRYRYDAARSRLEELPAPDAGRSGNARVVAPSARSSPGTIATAAPAVAARDASNQRPRGAPPSAAPPAAAPVPQRPARHVVALDPGHGGRDVGMIGPLGASRIFLREKDVTLAVGRAVADELRRRGVDVVLTRATDTLIALADRGRIAAAKGAGLFVSIHVNAANPHLRHAEGERGFETYFLAEARTEDARRVEQMENESVRFETDARAPSGDPMRFILLDLAQNEHLRESSQFAAIMEEALKRVHPAEARGVKQAGFAVLATSYMPAVLVELGYGSNYEEARFLTSVSGQRRLAGGIADAIAQYLEEYDRRLAAGGGGPR